MDIDVLHSFLVWCTIINGSILLLWSVVFVAAPDLMYRTQKKWFTHSQETFNLVFYCFLGAFKILFSLFNLIPLIALSISMQANG